MFKWFLSLFTFFKKERPLPELTEIELVLAERNKRMPFLGGGHFDGENHILCIGPGWKLSNQTNKAIDKKLATRIPDEHSVIID